MTKATFTAWLAGTELIDRGGPAGSVYVVAVRNEAAQAWLSQRLYKPVRRTLQAVTEDDRADVRFVFSPSPDSGY